MPRRTTTLFLACAVGTSACGATSTYTPARVQPGEITWSYDGRFVPLRDGRPLTEDASPSEAVACVPRAEEAASSAEASAVAGTILSWTGVSAFLGGTGAAVAGIATHDNTHVYVGLGGLGVGLVLALIGGDQHRGSEDHPRGLPST